MVRVYVSIGLQNIRSCFKGNLERYDLKNQPQQIEFTDDIDHAEVVIAEPNSVYLFSNTPTIVLSDNEELVKEFEQVFEICPFPMASNDLPCIHKAVISVWPEELMNLPYE